MPDSRGSRFLLEVLFLAGLAVGLALADLTPLEIAGGMALGWLIVALLEWAAWRDEPHYASGNPPRYYVPNVDLPPPQPLEQVASGYPDAHRDEAPTWIASAELRAEMLGEWPLAVPVVEAPADAEPEPEPEPRPEAQPVVAEDEPELQLEPDDPWVVAELPPPPVGEPEPAEPAAPEPAAPEVRETPPEVVLVESVQLQRVARYSLDPLAEPPPKKRFGRRAPHAAPGVEVPARPDGARALPGATREE